MDYGILADNQIRCQCCGSPALKIFTWEVMVPMTMFTEQVASEFERKLTVCAACMPAMRKQGLIPVGPKGRILHAEGRFTYHPVKSGKSTLLQLFGLAKLKAGSLGFRLAEIKIDRIWLFEKIASDRYRMCSSHYDEPPKKGII